MIKNIPIELLDIVCRDVERTYQTLPFNLRGIKISRDLIAATLVILNQESGNSLPQNCRNDIAGSTPYGLDKFLKEKRHSDLRTANIISDVISDAGYAEVYKQLNVKTGRMIKWTKSKMTW